MTTPPLTVKRCKKCGEEKILSCFRADKRNPKWVNSTCKSCEHAQLQMDRAQNRERYRGYFHGWKKSNQEKVKAINRHRIDSLADHYVASILGAPVAAIPRELLELQREQILLKRARRELRDTLEKLNDHTV